jgi:hypothetical protein
LVWGSIVMVQRTNLAGLSVVTLRISQSANPKGIVPSSPRLRALRRSTAKARGTSYPGSGDVERSNRNAVASHSSQCRRNRVAVNDSSNMRSQGSSCVAALGFAPESRWDSIFLPAHRKRASVGSSRLLRVADPRSGARLCEAQQVQLFKAPGIIFGNRSRDLSSST